MENINSLCKIYTVIESNGNSADEKAEYLVLKLDKEPASRNAAIAYAATIAKTNEKLSKEIIEKAISFEHGNTINIPAMHIITQEDIDGILDTAFAGGINYWVHHIETAKKPNIFNDDDDIENLSMSEFITRGGEIHVLADDEEGDIDEEYSGILTLQNVKKGIVMYINRFGYTPECWDAETGDCVVQYALFGELIFG